MEHVIYTVWTSDKDVTQMWRWWPSSGNALNLRSYLPPSLTKLTWSGRLYIDEVPLKNKTIFGYHAYTTIRLPILGIMV
jgi:hypothetical protein